MGLGSTGVGQKYREGLIVPQIVFRQPTIGVIRGGSRSKRAASARPKRDKTRKKHKTTIACVRLICLGGQPGHPLCPARKGCAAASKTDGQAPHPRRTDKRHHASKTDGQAPPRIQDGRTSAASKTDGQAPPPRRTDKGHHQGVR